MHSGLYGQIGNCRLVNRNPEDHRILRVAAFAVPAAVWLLGIVPPPRGGVTLVFLAPYTAVLVGLCVVDWAVSATTAGWARVIGLGTELLLAIAAVALQGSLVRPALVFMLPASRALALFGERTGLAASALVWLAYGVNIVLVVWPDRLNEFPNYLSFFLGLYVVTVVLTSSILQQSRNRHQLQLLYDELQQAHRQLVAMQRQTAELAVTRERNRIAREIHDSVAHYLTVITVQLEAAEKLAAQPSRAQEQVQRARRLTIECLEEVRRSVGALRSAPKSHHS